VKKRSAIALTDGQVLMDHIRELRTRLVVCAIVLVIGGVVGYLFYGPILEWLRSPLGTDLYYNTPAGSFNFILKVSAMVGILAMVPFIIFQLIMFVQPVFREKLSTPRIVFYTIVSVLLAVTGALFAFYGILPGALRFFAGFQVTGLSAIIDANNYLNFVINAIVTFIIVFQIPLLMIIIDRIKPISPKKLLSMEKYVVIGGLLVSLLVPFAMDITTSILIASPIIILYNLSVAMIFIRHAVARKERVEKVVKTPVIIEAPVEESLFTEEAVVESQPIVLVAEPELVLEKAIEFEQPVNAPLQAAIHKNIGIPLHEKPLPGKVNVQELQAQIRARREQEIADRIAQYNNPTFKVINDIR